jgi:hypothetical protein
VMDSPTVPGSSTVLDFPSEFDPATYLDPYNRRRDDPTWR